MGPCLFVLFSGWCWLILWPCWMRGWANAEPGLHCPLPPYRPKPLTPNSELSHGGGFFLQELSPHCGRAHT
jgi:hypothetical protein